ncbi:ABC transporter substrate-binding protein [Candidatus Bipolaricaulota bacterium]|nr:ABC transporter substrate-binding protein [Candidatus Bipolaricaulota bacterium]
MKKIALIAASLLLVFASVAVLAQDYKVVPLGVPGTLWEDFEVGVHGGTIRSSMISNPRTFNPIMVRDTASGWLDDRMQEALILRNPHTGVHEPYLAKAFEIAEDGLSITVHLRRGLKWSDGEPFTAADVMFTWVDLWLNEDVEARRELWTLPDGMLPTFEQIDDYTVVVHFTTIFRPAVGFVTGAQILPRHRLWEYVAKLNPALEGVCQFNTAWGIDVDPAAMAGMGAFILEHFITDMEIRLVRNPHFWQFDAAGNRLPYLDAAVVHIVESIDVSLLRFLNGEIDTYGARPEDLAILKAEGPLRGFETVISDVTGWGTAFFAFNQDVPEDENLRGLFRDLRFRQAVAHSIDLDTIIEGIYMGFARPQWSHVAIPSPFFMGDEHAIWFEYDLDKAASLLDEIGLFDTDGDGVREFPDGSPVTFVLITNAGHTIREQKCLILADDLARIGVDVVTSFIPFGALVGQLLGAEYQAVMIGLTGGMDAHGGRTVYHSTGSLHFWRFSAGGPDGRLPERFPVADPAEWNARVDELYDLGVGSFDEAEIMHYYHEMQIIIRENLPLMFTVSPLQMASAYDRIGNGLWETFEGIHTGTGLTAVTFAFRRDL